MWVQDDGCRWLRLVETEQFESSRSVQFAFQTSSVRKVGQETQLVVNGDAEPGFVALAEQREQFCEDPVRESSAVGSSGLDRSTA